MLVTSAPAAANFRPPTMNVLGEVAGDDVGVDVLQLAQHTVRADRRDLADQTTFGPAVLLTDDHVLTDVDQPAGQVAGVGGPQRGVRQALACAVGGDEELQHGEALAEV